MNRFIKYLLPLLLVLMLSQTEAQAQRVMLKTNGLGWVTGCANAGAEFRLSRFTTLNIEGLINPMRVGNYRFHTVALQPEIRYWFEGRPQTRHFVGVMASAGIYDWRLSDTNHRGDAFGLGVTYGYSLVLNNRWSVEGTVGAGLLRYREYKYTEDEVKPDGFNHKGLMFFPLKAAISFVYILK
ncbi:MAG: DUF3575 domain-containing protein [Bacteroidaceae bacterium]|nr:DUF3575 domain-containing protein [Bacteroidaceae bacterium]